MAFRERGIERRTLSTKDAMQNEFANHLLQCIGLSEVAYSELIESAHSKFEKLGMFEKKDDSHNPDTVGYFLHMLQVAEIVEEAGETAEVAYRDGIRGILREPILRLSEKGRKLYQGSLSIE